MRKRSVNAVWLLVPSLWFACEVDRSLGHGPGGAGEAGAGNDNGEAGNGAGSGATGGSAGSGGSGVSGNGGSTAGSSHVGGCGPQTNERLDDAACAPGSQPVVNSTCTLEQTSAKLGCGEPGSAYQAGCCARQKCEENSDCGDGARCLPRLVQSPGDVGPMGSAMIACGAECNDCICGSTANYDLGGYCIGADEEIARFDCPVTGVSCEGLDAWKDRIESRAAFVLFDAGTGGSTNSVQSEIRACRERINAELDDRCGGCDYEPGEPFDDSHCETPTFTMEGSTCTAAETREQLACGEPGSPFDTACCRRPDCDSDDACGDGARCLPRQVQAPMLDDFRDSGYEACEPTCAGCQCWVTQGLDVSGFCIPAEDVARFDCPVAGVDCEDLTMWRDGLDIYQSVAVEFREPHPAAEMQRCLERVEAELIASCGGCGEDLPEPIDLSHCERSPFYLGSSTCSAEQTRDNLYCGVPGSPQDADCCRRQECDGDEACGSGASCIPATINIPGLLSQRGRLFECRADTCDGCTCWATMDAGPAYDAFCIGAGEDVSRFDCPVNEAGCDALVTWRDGLPAYRDAFTEQSRPALAERVDACLARVATELAARCGDD